MMPVDSQLPRTKSDAYVLWTKGGIKSEVIISAHGDRPYTSNAMRSISFILKPLLVPPGMTLVFYCPDGQNLKTGTISHDFLVKNLAGSPHHEIQSGAPYSDIDLTKFTMTTRENENANIQKCLDQYDVITIRKERWHRLDLSLSTLLEDIRGRNYSKVHCYFCMGGLDAEVFVSGSMESGGFVFESRDI